MIWRKTAVLGKPGLTALCHRANAATEPRAIKIIIMASTRAIQSEPDTEAYAAAKGALGAMTHALAISLGPDIRVNAVLPGWIETRLWAKAQARETVEHRGIDREQHPVGRVGEPSDIAATVLFLASEGAGFITGQQITVDGGMTRKTIDAH